MNGILLGFVSNGEFNTMRVKGYTRPLSVLQVKADAKKKYMKMAMSTMVNMLTLKGVLIDIKVPHCWI